MPKIVNYSQGSPEWLEWRRNKVSASNIAIIMGLNPKKSPLMLYNQMLSGEQDPVNAAMQRGLDYEETARNKVCTKLGVIYAPTCIEKGDNPDFIASLDGYNAEATVSILEIKCPGKAAHEQAKIGVVPSLYYPQCQWQMFCADADKMMYCSYDVENDDLEMFEVKRDEKFIAKAEIAANEFLANLRGFVEPEPMDMDCIEILDPESNEKMTRYEFLKNRMQDDKKEMDSIEEDIKKKSDYRSAKIGKYYYKKHYRKGAIDTKKISEEYKINLEDYRKSSVEYWRFS